MDKFRKYRDIHVQPVANKYLNKLNISHHVICIDHSPLYINLFTYCTARESFSESPINIFYALEHGLLRSPGGEGGGGRGEKDEKNK